MIEKNRALLAGMAIIVVATVSFLALGAGNAEDAFLYRNADVVAEGKALYSENCASCHGADLKGEPGWQGRDADGYAPAPPHDASGHTWHHPDAQLFDITKLGTEAMVGGNYKSNMIGFGDVLSDDQIRAVLAFIKSTWPERIVTRHDQLNAATAVR